MSETSFPESALIANRVSVLLHGGLEDERRRWAEEAASHFSHEGPLREVRTPEELGACLGLARGVVYVPDVLKLGAQAQASLARSLFIQEERAKWVVGVVGSPESARERGAMREDLHYRLHRAQIDLALPGLREAIEQRRRERPVPRQPAAKSPASAPESSREGPSSKRVTAAATPRATAGGAAAPSARVAGVEKVATEGVRTGDGKAKPHRSGPEHKPAQEGQEPLTAKPAAAKAKAKQVGAAPPDGKETATAVAKHVPAKRTPPARGGAARSATPKKAAKREAAGASRSARD